jgi:hypothetical protein
MDTMTTATPNALTSRTSRYRWTADLHEAHLAGLAAVEALTPEPMTVVGNGRSFFVEGGVCGFARVEVRPRTSAWAKWLLGAGWRSSDYFRCVTLNVSDFGQSLQRKEAYAAAFAAYLTALGYPGVSYTATID